MNDITIRKGTVNDSINFVNLINQVWRIAYKDIFPEEVFIYREKNKERKIQQYLNLINKDSYIYYLAEHNNKLIGVLWGTTESEYEHFNKMNYADLIALYILPEYQHLGIGQNLKDKFIEWAKEKEMSKFVIGVLKSNLKARRAYEKWGGKLDSHSQNLTLMDNNYDEVFYTFNI